MILRFERRWARATPLRPPRRSSSSINVNRLAESTFFGSFNRAGGAVRYDLARFDATGALDPAFVPAKELSYSSSSLDRHSSILANIYTTPAANAVQPDGKLLILAKLPVNTSGATETANLVRLNLDGSLDTAFQGPVVGASHTATSNIITLPLANGKIMFFSEGILQRLNPDGSRDTSFAIVHVTNNTWGGPIASPKLIPQSDGGYLLYGYFDAINGVARVSVARVASDGTLDASFDPGSKLPPFQRFTGAVLQLDQKIVLYGEFTGYSGTTSNCIIRLLPSGELDPSFEDVHVTRADDNPTIEKVYLQPDGRIIILGFFTGVDGAARSPIARLNSDGSLDGTFDAAGMAGDHTFYEGLPSVLLQPDGKLILYGAFTHAASQRSNLIRLNADGSFDDSFFPGIGQGPGYDVLQVAMLPNNQLLVLGGFYSRNGFARLNNNGTFDQTYDPAATLFSASNTGARTIVPASDGKMFIGGWFTSVNGVARNCIARLDGDGTLDSTFDHGTGPNTGYTPQLAPSVESIAVQSDGKILVSGAFISFSGVARASFVRLEQDGAVDPGFNPADSSNSPYGYHPFVIAPNGQIYAAGKFVGQNPQDNLARINPNGTVDGTFHPAQLRAKSLAVQPDGKLVVLTDPLGTSNPEKSSLARLNLDGSLDSTFAAGAATPGIIRLAGHGNAVRIQSDGKIVVGGLFSPSNNASVADINHVKHPNLERFNSDGTPDPSFAVGGSGPNGEVNDVFLKPNGAIMVGGNFTSVNGIARRGVAVLTPNGEVDESVNPGDGPDNAVTAVAAQPDGKLLISGRFTNVGAVPRHGIARLLVPSGQLQNLSTRMQVRTGDNVLISGFIVTGANPKKVLIRGVGPSLPVSGQLTDPVLELFDGAGASIGKNDNWRDSQEQEIKDTTIPPTNSLESALVRTVPPGNYTAVLNGKNDGTGVGLMEVYDLSQTASQLGNISTRGLVGNGNDVLIGGVIIGQSPNGSSATVLVRAIGPSLTTRGISGALLNPALELRDANGGLIAQNDDWRDGQEPTIQDTTIPPEDDRESALVQVLTAGNYTAIVRGNDEATGIGLVEIYTLQ